jgi:hypothetical protein
MKSTVAEISNENIAIRAYELYVNGGCQEGQAEENWLRAEAELKASLAPTKKSSVTTLTAATSPSAISEQTTQIMTPPVAAKKKAPSAKVHATTM